MSLAPTARGHDQIWIHVLRSKSFRVEPSLFLPSFASFLLLLFREFRPAFPFPFRVQNRVPEFIETWRFRFRFDPQAVLLQHVLRHRPFLRRPASTGHRFSKSFLEVVFRAEMSIQRAEMCLCIDDMNRDLNVFRRVVGCTHHSSALITRHQHHQHRQRRRKRPDANTRKRTRTTKKKVKSVVPSQDGERSFFLETLKAWTKTTQKRKDTKEEEGKTKTFTKKD